VRHGRTAWNADGRFQGQSDIELDETGRTQARALGAFLKHDAFDVIASSDLARAQETAVAIVGRALHSTELDPSWREMAFGGWEGLTWAEIVARFPETAADRPSNVPRFGTPPGGESFEAVCARVSTALRALLERVPEGGKALVVTHAGVLHALLRVALSGPESEALKVRFVPASVTRLVFESDRARLLTLNEVPPG
jgi:broad specificity phosphatase PhoE